MDGLELIGTALINIVARGVEITPTRAGGWEIKLAPETPAERDVTSVADDRPEGWIGGLGGS